MAGQPLLRRQMHKLAGTPPAVQPEEMEKALELAAKRLEAHAAFRDRPLQFGDAKQIAALREWRRQVEVLEARMEATGMVSELWVYEVEYERRLTALVIASSEQEARKLLEDEIGADGSVTGPARRGELADAEDEAGVEDDGA